jgi:hypothetical protein
MGPADWGPLAIMSDGVVASEAFEYEVKTMVEFIGTVPGVTKSHTDLPGLSVIRDQVNNTVVVEESSAGLFQKAITWITDNGVVESSGAVLSRVGEGLLKRQVGL